ncbi:MAG: ATP-binding protein [Terracidiphilus sp.]
MADEVPQGLSRDEKYRLKGIVLTTFTPGRPVNNLDLLAGRDEQINKVLEAVLSPGQHAAIYGERGVGKSSLANLIYDMVFATGKQTFIPVRMNCSASISFPEIWAEIFRQLESQSDSKNLLSQLPEHSPNSEDIRAILHQVDRPSIIVIDEYDRVDESVAVPIADTIKTLSDRDINATLVLVGVANSVQQLIREHSSIDRALIQIQMPRMSESELIDIVTKGMARLPELALEDGLDQRMANVSKGLPHFTHLLAKHAVLASIESGHSIVTSRDYEKALKSAAEEKSQSLGHLYRTATHSSKENIFEEVLLACALATDEQGLFGAKDVRSPLSRILNRQMKIEAYIRHLDKFSQPERGPALKKEGQKRKIQYSFVEPMMQPYVLMKGLSEKKITEEQLGVLSSAPLQPSLSFAQSI